MSRKKKDVILPLASAHPDAVDGPASLAHHRYGFDGDAQPNRENVALECGWGKLILAHTYERAEDVAVAVQDERLGSRNIAIYVRDPHVILAQAPLHLFLDPSHTFRLPLPAFDAPALPPGLRIRPLETLEDAEAINRIYLSRHMVPADPGFLWTHRDSPNIVYLVAEDIVSRRVIGTVTGVDHVNAFGDPEAGSSLWCLAVDPGAPHPGIGQALACDLAARFKSRNRAFMDLSVMHDNEQAIALYEKLGFERVPVFAIKRKNAINERLFTGPTIADDDGLNIYARIIVDEARRRGVRVEILDAEAGYFRLTFGGRSITCRESLSQLTTSIAMSRCQDKRITRRILRDAGLNTPEQRTADGGNGDVAFLHEHGAVVVKPADGEQGQGISVDIRDAGELRTAIDTARRHDETVLIERYCPGEDLRIVVIGYKVVAAAVRKPPEITGDGRRSVRELIEKLSRRRESATGGESRIPMDAETERCVRLAGHSMDEVLAEGQQLAVRKTANLHTGGTLHDVTHVLHPQLCAAAVEAAKALEIPVTGLDLLVAAPTRPDYVIIEANERPGLANHEPQPIAERFIDFLFPFSVTREPQEML
jgi:GNAT-family acetyltransferase (TIGR03103 family)